MTANSDPASRPVSATLAPVAPSLMVKVVMRPMTLVLNYLATKPEFLDRQAAAPLLASLFSPADRAFFRLLSIKQYLSLHVAPTDAAFDD
jgi:hypothetical protein